MTKNNKEVIELKKDLDWYIADFEGQNKETKKILIKLIKEFRKQKLKGGKI